MLEPTATPGFSKLGGLPNLAGQDWPWRWNAPAGFLAQIDLAQVKAAGGPDWLPGEGRLYFFGDANGDGAATVLHALAGEYLPPPMPAPSELDEANFYDEKWVAFRAAWALDEDSLPGDMIDTVDIHALDLLGRDLSRPQHRMFGPSDRVQPDDPRRSCAPSKARGGRQAWRLLLQVDHDDDIGTMFHDEGRVYFFIHEDDARAGDFSKIVTASQFC